MHLVKPLIKSNLTLLTAFVFNATAFADENNISSQSNAELVVNQAVNTNPTSPATADYGFTHLVLDSNDIVLQLTFGFLVLMSVVSWTIIIYQAFVGFYQMIKSHKHYKLLIEKHSTYELAYQHMVGKSSVKSMLANALKSYEDFKDEKGPLGQEISYSEYLSRNIRSALERFSYTQDAGLSVLATIGATAPFVGLFGTVWGIHNALINVSKAGNISIGLISGPIGEALIATAVGLFVAIPAVMAYNVYVRRNRVVRRKMESLAHDLYNSFLSRNSKE